MGMFYANGTQDKHIRVGCGHFRGQAGEFIEQPFRIVPVNQEMRVMRRRPRKPGKRITGIAGQHVTAPEFLGRAVDRTGPHRATTDEQEVDCRQSSKPAGAVRKFRRGGKAFLHTSGITAFNKINREKSR
ncbi:MAG TPA: hypothetical protein VGC09_14655 [Rhodopila sp.]